MGYSHMSEHTCAASYMDHTSSALVHDWLYVCPLATTPPANRSLTSKCMKYKHMKPEAWSWSLKLQAWSLKEREEAASWVHMASVHCQFSFFNQCLWAINPHPCVCVAVNAMPSAFLSAVIEWAVESALWAGACLLRNATPHSCGPFLASQGWDDRWLCHSWGSRSSPLCEMRCRPPRSHEPWMRLHHSAYPLLRRDTSCEFVPAQLPRCCVAVAAFWRGIPRMSSLRGAGFCSVQCLLKLMVLAKVSRWTWGLFWPQRAPEAPPFPAKRGLLTCVLKRSLFPFLSFR